MDIYTDRNTHVTVTALLSAFHSAISQGQIGRSRILWTKAEGTKKERQYKTHVQNKDDSRTVMERVTAERLP